VSSQDTKGGGGGGGGGKKPGGQHPPLGGAWKCPFLRRNKVCHPKEEKKIRGPWGH